MLNRIYDKFFLKSNLKIQNSLKELGFHKVKKQAYDYVLQTNSKTVLLKVVKNYKKREITINNKNFWTFNKKKVESKSDLKKINNIYDLINFELKENKEHILKVYLIYPTAKVIIKAVNESEYEFVEYNKKSYGVNIVKYDELHNLKELLK